ncbi:hypothetical protein [Microbacterium sp.]|uniref:hypothetical protein n=1 Tax=Microbacterium sp. TaxID=51671 RepID=UPI0039E2B18E
MIAHRWRTAALSVTAVLTVVAGLLTSPTAMAVGADPVSGSSAATAESAAPTIAGDATTAGTLWVVPGSWPDDTRFSYQWYADGAPIDGATGSSLRPSYEHEGMRIHVVVTGALPSGESESRASTPTARVGVVRTPVISGSRKVGGTLQATADWTSVYTLTYQWLIDGAPAGGATGQTYVVPASAEGAKISVRVTGTAAGYATGSATSAATAQILRVGTVTIEGDAVVGRTIVGVPGTWTDGTSLSTSWLVDGRSIQHPGRELLITASMLGKRVSFSVSGTKGGWHTGFSSATTGEVIAPGSVAIAGTAAVGRTLTAKPAGWNAATTFTYQWSADGVDVSGATASSFRPTAGQADKRLTVRISGAMSGRSTLVSVSAPTSRVMTPGTPKISGKTVIGSVLTASPGTWAPGTTLSYQWYVGDMAMVGANRPTYRLDDRAVDQPIRVKVTAKRAGYDAVSVTSAPTQRAVRIPQATVYGDMAVYGTVAVDFDNTWRKGTTLSYRWLRDGKPISGASSWRYVLKKSDLGHRVTARVTAKIPGYGTVVKTTPSMGKVGTSYTPRLRGTARVGATLRFEMTSWMPGTRYSYKWMSDGHPVPGARSKTLVLSPDLVGTRITVVVTGRTLGYATASATSSQTAKVARTAKPTIGGVAKVGQRLTAKPGKWTTGTTLRYQWRADGKAIPRATRSTLTVTTSLRGKKITVTVVGTKPGYTTVARTSSATRAVR